jgi:translation initiation factor IF-3
VRVIDDEGEQLGVMGLEAALNVATERGLDLVEVSPNATPPVCRIMDYGKVQYERQKRQTSGAKQHRMQLKQIRLRAKTGQHDIDVKVKKAREFLGRKDKVKINVLFRGREVTHPEFGRRILERVATDCVELGQVESHPNMSGRFMSMVIGPTKK